jgi:hypothetical protein
MQTETTEQVEWDGLGMNPNKEAGRAENAAYWKLLDAMSELTAFLSAPYQGYKAAPEQFSADYERLFAMMDAVKTAHAEWNTVWEAWCEAEEALREVSA